MRTRYLALALTLPLVSSSCVAALGVGAGIVASQELANNNTYITHLNQDVKTVWPQVKLFLADASMELIEMDDELRVARARIDGSVVTVGVEAYDIDRTVMKVNARKFGVNDGEMARIVTERIQHRLIGDG